jgi:hypothetical protein
VLHDVENRMAFRAHDAVCLKVIVVRRGNYQMASREKRSVNFPKRAFKRSIVHMLDDFDHKSRVHGLGPRSGIDNDLRTPIHGRFRGSAAAFRGLIDAVNLRASSVDQIGEEIAAPASIIQWNPDRHATRDVGNQ